MIAFEYGEIAQQQAKGGKPYLQFINEGTMSLGLFVLAAGSTDTQSPHEEDEIYYVVSGRGAIVVAGERRPVDRVRCQRGRASLCRHRRRSLDPGFLCPAARTAIIREH